jgi:SpoVK/Ycf46/Vps4 family AAA+-type ATPase
MKKIQLSESQAIKRIEEHRTVHNKTSLSYLREHNGLRPKNIHLLLGMPSGGKSTVRNTILFDYLASNQDKKIFLWLSEESEEAFLNDLSYNMDQKKNFERIVFHSEQDSLITSKGEDSFLNFKESIIKSQCNLLVFDNITTSRLYGESFDKQTTFSLNLKSLINQMPDLAILVVAHTSSTIKEGNKELININDIRGSKTIVNLAEFQYIMQTFKINGGQHTTLRIVKHRSMIISNTLFKLDFDAKRKIYASDKPVDFDLFVELYNMQDSLSAKKNKQN